MRGLIALVAAVALTAALPAFAANWSDDRDLSAAGMARFVHSKAICRSLKHMPRLPQTAALPGPLAAHSSEALYYGIGVPPDPAAARQAALRERTHPDDHAAFQGDVMLMTIYANGVGAPRDFDRAIDIACNLDGAPAEEDGRVSHLATLEAQHWTGHDFSFCDDATSGSAMGTCAAHDAALEDAQRKQRFAALIAGWSAEERRAFQPLQKAAADFAKTDGDNEVDLSGTARAAMVIDERQAQQKAFLDLLLGLDSGQRPAFTAQQADDADAKLNAAYQTIQHAPNPASWGTVTKDGIRTTERAWLRYRDAWIAFARARFPAVPADSIRAALTQQRTAALEAFLR